MMRTLKNCLTLLPLWPRVARARNWPVFNGKSAGELSTRSFWRYPIILLAGEKGSGKSTVAKILADEYGFELCRLGDYVRSSVSESGLELTTINERQRMCELKANVEGTVLVHLEPAIYGWLDYPGKLCVDSLFDLNDLNFFRRRSLHWRLIFLTCNQQICFQRIKDRHRQGDANIEMWICLEHRRYDFRPLADYEISNDDGMDSLRQKVRRLFVRLVQEAQ